MKIKLITETLSDESKVYNVHLAGVCGGFDIACIDENNANLLIQKITKAFEQHTVESVEFE